MVQAFYSKLESVLQSSKFDSLKINDPFHLKIKMLGEEHMKEIRQEQEAVNKRLNIPNYGLENFIGFLKSNLKVSKCKKKDTYLKLQEYLHQTRHTWQIALSPIASSFQ